MKKTLLTFILAIGVCLPVLAQGTWPADVAAALAKAGKNRTLLESLLEEYRREGHDEAYRAACFLIAGMTHSRIGGYVRSYDAAVDSFRRAAVRDFFKIINDTALPPDTLRHRLREAAAASSARFSRLEFSEPEVEPDDVPDIEAVDGGFLRRRIEHALTLRRQSERLRRLPFEEFCEYVLPYRAIPEYPLLTETDSLLSVFGVFLKGDAATDGVSADSVTAIVARYNKAVTWLRRFHGRNPFDTMLGLPDLFFSGTLACTDMAEYCVGALRAVGIPAAVETNVAFRVWDTRHFWVAVRGNDGRWHPISPEADDFLMSRGDMRSCLNIHRLHFGRYADNPSSLTLGSGEPLPDELSAPDIEDVSAAYLDVTGLTLPVTLPLATPRRLVYLAAFTPGTGLTAVTWGEVKGGTAAFRNVVKGNIYFPVYCADDGRLLPVGDPFFLHDDSTAVTGYRLEPFLQPTGKSVAVRLQRKYPRKPRLLRQAAEMVGTVVLGSEDPRFKEADTLAVITATPDAAWTDLPLNTTRPYRYYRVKAPAAHPHMRLSELQFLTRREHAYENTVPPTPLDGGPAREDSLWQRLLDAPLEACRKKAEYDGNVQTAPEGYPDVTLRLERPQWVERLRYVVKHADNGVTPGDRYCLMKWGAKGWEYVWQQTAVTNSLDAGCLEAGALYWLDNLSRGREELPFIVCDDGTVKFPHTPILEDVEAGR